MMPQQSVDYFLGVDFPPFFGGIRIPFSTSFLGVRLKKKGPSSNVLGFRYSIGSMYAIFTKEFTIQINHSCHYANSSCWSH